MHSISNILSSDISVIVQGAVGEYTKFSLESIRKILPDAELILSTWKNSYVDDLDYDILIENDDPGSFPCDIIENSLPNNINRQLVSTKAGLNAATRKYAVKMRTDFYLKSSEFLKYFNYYRYSEDKFAIFSSRLLCCDTYTRNPRYKYKELVMPLCPSDFFFFGYTADLKNLFDIPLVSNIEQKRFFEYYPEFTDELKYKNALCQYMPEQFIWIGFLKKYYNNIFCQHRDQVNEQNCVLTEHTFVNNLVILSAEKLGIGSFKENLFTKGMPETCFDFFDWKLLYYAFCKKIIFFYWIYRIRIFSRNLWRKYVPQIKENHLIQQLSTHKFLSISDLAELPSKIKPKYKYISFDIFDTVLFRNIAPDWVPMSQTGLYAALLLKNFNRLASPELINSLRNKYIEQNNAANLVNGLDAEYLLDDIIKKIVEYFNIPESYRTALTNQIVENETERELACMYVNPAFYELLHTLKKEGKKIVLISDMYLSEASIVYILQKLNIYKYVNNIFISSRYKYTKRSGMLYQIVLKELKINNKQIIHIGDNLHSDVKMAREQGIYSLWYHDTINEQRKKTLSQYSQNEINLTDYIKSLLPEYDETFYGYIRKYFGVDNCNFVFKLMIDSQLLGIECLYFLERDGNIYKEIFETLQTKIILFKNIQFPELKLLKLSRKDTACLLDLNNLPLLIEHVNKVNPPKHFSIKHFIGCFGILPTDIPENIYNEILEHNSSEAYLKKIYSSSIKPILNMRQKKVVDFLKNKGFYQYSKIGLVDIGWGGTSQKDITAHIIDQKLHMSCYGFYYACDERIKELPGNYYFYHNACNLLYGYSLLEFVVKSYTSSKSEIKQASENYPALKATLRKNFIARKAILDSADEFCVLVNQYALTVNNISLYSQPSIIEFIQNPPVKFVNYIKDVFFSLDRKVNDSYIPLIDKINNFHDLQEQYLNAQWVQGSKVISNIYDFSHLKKNRFLAKIGQKHPYIVRAIKSVYYIRKLRKKAKL